MSEIVIELKNRNWTNKRISKQLGMDEEEVLRLCQVSGLEHLFSDRDFSKAWVSEESDEQYFPITDTLTPIEIYQFKAGNTNDAKRIFHTFDKWECNKIGFFASVKHGWSHEECGKEFKRILSDQKLFSSILEKVIVEWKYSCEHYLTNSSMNRIAWLGQAAVCYESGIPSKYSNAWFDIEEPVRNEANETALKYLNLWLSRHGFSEKAYNEAAIIGRQVELY
jgi:hypothetical protein